MDPRRQAELRSGFVKPLRVGVVGFGKLGLLQAALANALPGTRLCAVADTSSKLLSIFNDWKPDVECFSDYTTMLDTVPLDAVVIATPTHLHIPIALKVLEKQLPVFIEKPLSLTSEQARPLIDLVRKSKGVTSMVGYMNRFHETFQEAKNILTANVLGKLQTLRTTMYISQLMQRGKGWRYDKAQSGGGVLITQNSHLLDLLLWLFGDIDWVSTHMQSLYSETVEDSVHCYMCFSSGLQGWMDTSWSKPHHRTLTTQIEVQGENGTLTFNDDEVRLYLESPTGNYPQGWTIKKKPDLFEGVSFDVGGPHYSHQMETFLSAVRNHRSADPDIEAAFKVQCLIDAAYRSATGGGTKVPVDYK